ncbi:MAG: serine/threonine-protein kinase [Pyrinomonadaceae bacterium]|nr:serine/threonine-protein kinase [Pyrinomonadaceae bacterium]
MATNLPDSIAHYKIISAIGAGGMGEVYLAQDTKLERQVALKVLLDEVAGDEERVRRFVQEAKAASALNHPNILTVYEIGEFDYTRYIATELIKGETLRDRLRGEPMTLREVLDVAMQVAAALNAAHSAGIVHRDIKPENIMLRDDGIVKVLDFGLAKLTATPVGPADSEDATRAQVNTRPGVVMGTVLYMSPEQARGKETDARSDIWSLGVVIYEMLAGATPFVGETANDSIAAILAKEPPPLDEATPPELRRIVRKSLQKQTDERYQTVKDLLLDVKNLKPELEFSEELERSSVPQSTGSSNVSTVQRSENATAIHTGVISTQNSMPQQMSSAEYLVTQVKRGKYWILPLAFLLIAAIGFGIYKYSASQPTNLSFESAKITKVTDSGKVGQVAISPDGKWLIYSVFDGGKTSLWLKQVAITDSNTQIVPPADVDYRGLAFSPDGNYLYYNASEGSILGTLYQVPVLGGTARKLISGVSGGISFSPDGKQITYGTEDLANDESILMIANADGTEPRQLLKLKGNDEMASSRGRWSPDGKTIALWTGTNNPRNWVISTVSVATGEITQFEKHKFYNYSVWEWLPDGKSLLTLAAEKVNQPLQFWQISYPSGEAKKVSNDLNNYSSISLTADASVLATVQSVSTSNIWTAPIGDSSRATQVTSGSNQNYNPVWTPDGRLVYGRGSGLDSDIYVTDPSGGSSKRLTSDKMSINPTVSPDGRYVVYLSLQSGFPAIWRMGIDGSDPKPLTTRGNSAEQSISPDGKEVIYSEGFDSVKIWKVGIDGGEPVQLTDNDAFNPVFSPDGKQFACLWRDEPNSQPKIAIIPSTGGKPVKTLTLNSRGYGLRWMPDGRSIAYIVDNGNVGNIWSQPIDGGTPKQITNFTSERMGSFDISPDGKQFAMMRGTETRDVVLISGIMK